MKRLWLACGIVVTGVAIALMPRPSLADRVSVADDTQTPMAPGVGMPGGPPTSAEGLAARVAETEKRLASQPDDLASAVLLADALLRQARASNDGRPAARAAEVLKAALKESPGAYDALRLLGAANLSLHRFDEALQVGERAREMRPSDAWNYGVIGDAHLELGDYDAAFESFDEMTRMRPSAAAYARVAYARELSGDMDGALSAMQMALAAAPPQDFEGQAWTATQLGELHLKMGRPADAEREFKRAVFLYPRYPLAMVGLGKVRLAAGDRDAALAAFTDQLSRTPTLDLAARIGDLHAAAGRSAEAEHAYELAEQLAGPAPAQTEANLALFLAERHRKVDVAVQIAEAVSLRRHDITTDHALAMAYFRAGRLRDAAAAMARARRTGSVDERLLAHARELEQALSRSHQS